MRKTLLTVATVTLFTPGLLLAQTNANVRGTAHAAATATTQGTADAAAQARMQAAIEHASSVGVPQSMLESKIAEGRAKGASMARIATAVEHRAEVLTRVQSAFNARAETVSQAELQSAADAHERGVSIESITALSARAGNDRAVALSVLADLVATGGTPEHALLRVQAALDGGASSLVRLSAPPRNGNASVNVGGNVNADTQTTTRAGGATVRGAGAVRVNVGG